MARTTSANTASPEGSHPHKDRSKLPKLARSSDSATRTKSNLDLKSRMTKFMSATFRRPSETESQETIPAAPTVQMRRAAPTPPTIPTVKVTEPEYAGPTGAWMWLDKKGRKMVRVGTSDEVLRTGVEERKPWGGDKAVVKGFLDVPERKD